MFVFQCQRTNGAEIVKERVCDLQAVEKKFKAAGYTSIVSVSFFVFCTNHLRQVKCLGNSTCLCCRRCTKARKYQRKRNPFFPMFMFDLFFFSPTQKSFHADVVSVMRKWLKGEELLPEEQKPTSRAKEHYVKVSFPPLFLLLRCLFIFRDIFH